MAGRQSLVNFARSRVHGRRAFRFPGQLVCFEFRLPHFHGSGTPSGRLKGATKSNVRGSPLSCPASVFAGGVLSASMAEE